MQEIKFCRNCEHWKTTDQWQGNCKKHPYEKDQWSQSASPRFNQKCLGEDFVDKSLKYQGVRNESIKH